MNDIMSQQRHTLSHSIQFIARHLNHFYRQSITFCSLSFKFSTAWDHTQFDQIQDAFCSSSLNRCSLLIFSLHLPAHNLCHLELQFLVYILFKHLQHFSQTIFYPRSTHPEEPKGSHSQCSHCLCTILEQIVSHTH